MGQYTLDMAYNLKDFKHGDTVIIQVVVQGDRVLQETTHTLFTDKDGDLAYHSVRDHKLNSISQTNKIILNN